MNMPAGGRSPGMLRNGSLKGLKYLFLVLLAASMFYPFIWVAATSLKNNDELYRSPFGLPVVFRFDNYATAWVNLMEFGKKVRLCL